MTSSITHFGVWPIKKLNTKTFESARSHHSDCCISVVESIVGHLAGSVPTACDLFSRQHMRMWEMEPDREIIWSTDPDSVEAMTTMLCHRVSYSEGAQRQVIDSHRLNGQMTIPPGT